MSETTSGIIADVRSAPQRALDLIADITIHIAVLALLGLVVVQGWQVFARYVINDSPSWTEPVTLLLLATAMSLGAATGVHTRRHFGFYLLAAHMQPGLRRAVDVFGSLVVAVLGVVIAWWAGVLLMDGLDIKAAGANLPQSINYLPLCIGGALMALFAVNQMVQTVQPAAVAEAEGDR
ncbi:TRAP transporter small permease [Stenotrophomonas aracearum]|jgi:TRAP-type C4-dicarboxylate transport system permease small subunit|uniref:TRAP transporter small permease protein n=1 Tax=Stenotrophomonas aracearum TaxID=3003272 RepID=A0ABY9YEH4_9GAMM|nr:TRAP transporter small permease [Stenotrophomonas sp. A5588]WNH48845.1 TRAP transporter small permease [Stenotrophomonas sp. A5588]